MKKQDLEKKNDCLRIGCSSGTKHLFEIMSANLDMDYEETLLQLLTWAEKIAKQKAEEWAKEILEQNPWKRFLLYLGSE